MVSKDDERKALDQIKKIINGLGPDSYIGAAIDSTVLELAADNIGNDFLITTTGKLEDAAAKLEESRKELREAMKTRDDLKTEINIISGRLEESERKAEGVRTTCEDIRTRNHELLEELTAAQKERDQMKQEIITLKAKLYDLMTA